MNQPLPEHLTPFRHQIAGLQQVGHQCWQRGWSLGTSSNYSVVLERDPLRLLVTASGKDKGHLQDCDFVIVDADGRPVPEGQPKSSAETLLHCSAAHHWNAGAVLHTHSPWATVLSDLFFAQRGILLEGYEFLKGFEGVTSHQTTLWVPIFENTQDIAALREEVEQYWKRNPHALCFAYLIRKHGLYTWGDHLPAATRHLEVIEFLLDCMGRRMSLRGSA
ncbi:MAG: methylthioribulose 1-phosphate dehydratase [Pirellulaceae bacterium]|jgi:methylthioribulose-1-phosphate dehydratase